MGGILQSRNDLAPPSVLAGRWRAARAFPTHLRASRAVAGLINPQSITTVSSCGCNAGAKSIPPSAPTNSTAAPKHYPKLLQKLASQNGSPTGGGWTFGGAKVRGASLACSGWWSGGAARRVLCSDLKSMRCPQSRWRDRRVSGTGKTCERPQASKPLQDATTRFRQI